MPSPPSPVKHTTRRPGWTSVAAMAAGGRTPWWPTRWRPADRRGVSQWGKATSMCAPASTVAMASGPAASCVSGHDLPGGQPGQARAVRLPAAARGRGGGTAVPAPARGRGRTLPRALERPPGRGDLVRHTIAEEGAVVVGPRAEEHERRRVRPWRGDELDGIQPDTDDQVGGGQHCGLDGPAGGHAGRAGRDR